MLKPEIIEDLIYTSGLSAQGTPDAWDTDHLTLFADKLYGEIMCSLGAHALHGYSALEAFAAIKAQYEDQ